MTEPAATTAVTIAAGEASPPPAPMALFLAHAADAGALDAGGATAMPPPDNFVARSRAAMDLLCDEERLEEGA